MKIIRFLRANLSYIMCILAALGLGFALGSSPLNPAELPDSTSQAQQSPDQPVGQIGSVSVLPTTQVEWLYQFTLCGHGYEAHPETDLTGYTLEDIVREYPDCRVTQMDAQHVKIERRIDEYCPEHYLLVTTEDSLCVFHTNHETMLSEQVMELNVTTQDMPEEIQYQLSSGLVFDSLEEINAYLEDAES